MIQDARTPSNEEFNLAILLIPPTAPMLNGFQRFEKHEMALQKRERSRPTEYEPFYPWAHWGVGNAHRSILAHGILCCVTTAMPFRCCLFNPKT